MWGWLNPEIFKRGKKLKKIFPASTGFNAKVFRKERQNLFRDFSLNSGIQKM